MRPELLQYYELELQYLRQMGEEFGRKFPDVARRLMLERDNCQDPHVERLLEGFALLAARVHLRIDDDYPELTAALLEIVHPGYLRPLPAMTIVEFQTDPDQGKRTAGDCIARNTMLVSKSTVDQLPCRFQTAFEVYLWPFTITQAEWRVPEQLQRPARRRNGEQAVAAARLRLRCAPDATFAGLKIKTLRFHLAGTPNVVYPLYEMLSRNCIEVQLRDPADPNRLISLDGKRVRMAGFDVEDALIPSGRRSMEGYRLLQEYFAFPEKFLFFDLDGLEPLGTAGFGQEAEIVFLFSKFELAERQQDLEVGVNARTFRLGCTPAINLFKQRAEPIQLSHTKHSYTIVPDSKRVRSMEIFNIEFVTANNPKLKKSVTLEPIHTYRYQTRERKDLAFWTATRNHNELGDREPSVMTISVVDLNGKLTDPDADVLTVGTMCTNFNLPSEFGFGSASGDFDVAGLGGAKTITALRRPTQTVDPPRGRGQLWPLISMLSLNYLSVNETGLTALQEILKLHNATRTAANENQIGAIRRLTSSPHFALVESGFGLVPARGTLIEMELEERQFTGGGAYLFTAVLERFLSGYCSMNTFSQLLVRTLERKEELARWPPRAGAQALL